MTDKLDNYRSLTSFKYPEHYKMRFSTDIDQEKVHLSLYFFSGLPNITSDLFLFGQIFNVKAHSRVDMGENIISKLQ